MPITNKNIIFDLDGTLIDSASSILAAFSYVFNLNHIQPIEPLSSSLIGPPLVTTLKLLSGISDKKKLQQMTADFKTYYDLEGCILCKPYEEVSEGLKVLAKNGFGLHIATNKRYTPTRKILKHLGWNALFTSVYTLDQNGACFKSKSEMIKRQMNDLCFSADQVIYVGDKEEDMEAARNNKLKFVCVSWGYGEFPEDVIVIKCFSQLDFILSQ